MSIKSQAEDYARRQIQESELLSLEELRGIVADAWEDGYDESALNSKDYEQEIKDLNTEIERLEEKIDEARDALF